MSILLFKCEPLETQTPRPSWSEKDNTYRRITTYTFPYLWQWIFFFETTMTQKSGNFLEFSIGKREIKNFFIYINISMEGDDMRTNSTFSVHIPSKRHIQMGGGVAKNLLSKNGEKRSRELKNKRSDIPGQHANMLLTKNMGFFRYTKVFPRF